MLFYKKSMICFKCLTLFAADAEGSHTHLVLRMHIHTHTVASVVLLNYCDILSCIFRCARSLDCSGIFEER